MKIEIDSETIVFANKIHRFDPVEQAYDSARNVPDDQLQDAFEWTATYLAALAARMKNQTTRETK
jgi:hypothetical protein